MKGSLLVMFLFGVGIIAGHYGIVPHDYLPENLTSWLLYLLVFQVGIGMGSSENLKKIGKEISIRSFLIPIGVAVGFIGFALLAGLCFKWISIPDSMAIGSGLGYYSLSSMLITELKTPEIGAQIASKLAALALLVNIFRELMALFLAPLFSKCCGKYGLIAAAGVTSMDVLLPSVSTYSGEEMVPSALINGVVLEFSVPLLVTLFCSL